MYITPTDFTKTLSSTKLFAKSLELDEPYLLCLSIKKDYNSNFSTYEEHLLDLLNKETFFFSYNKTYDIIKFLFPEENAIAKTNYLKNRLLDNVKNSKNFLNRESFSTFILNPSYDLHEKLEFIEKNDENIKNHHWCYLLTQLTKTPVSNFNYDELHNLKYRSKFNFKEINIFDKSSNPYHAILTSFSSSLTVNDKIKGIKELHNLGIPLYNKDYDLIYDAINTKAGPKIINTLLKLTDKFTLKNFIYYLIRTSSVNDKIVDNFFNKTKPSIEEFEATDFNNKPNWLSFIININSTKNQRYEKESTILLLDFLDKFNYVNNDYKNITVRSKLDSLKSDIVTSLIVEHDRKSINDSLMGNNSDITIKPHKKRL